MTARSTTSAPDPEPSSRHDTAAFALLRHLSQNTDGGDGRLDRRGARHGRGVVSRRTPAPRPGVLRWLGPALRAERARDPEAEARYAARWRHEERELP